MLFEVEDDYKINLFNVENYCVEHNNKKNLSRFKFLMNSGREYYSKPFDSRELNRKILELEKTFQGFMEEN